MPRHPMCQSWGLGQEPTHVLTDLELTTGRVAHGCRRCWQPRGGTAGPGCGACQTPSLVPLTSSITPSHWCSLTMGGGALRPVAASCPWPQHTLALGRPWDTMLSLHMLGQPIWELHRHEFAAPHSNSG